MSDLRKIKSVRSWLSIPRNTTWDEYDSGYNWIDYYFGYEPNEEDPSYDSETGLKLRPKRNRPRYSQDSNEIYYWYDRIENGNIDYVKECIDKFKYNPDDSFCGFIDGLFVSDDLYESCQSRQFEIFKLLLENTSKEYIPQSKLFSQIYDLDDYVIRDYDLEDYKDGQIYKEIPMEYFKAIRKVMYIPIKKCKKNYSIMASKIQGFFRIIQSKKIVNDLRSKPDNLFEPEFSIQRKRKLKIDDSMFKKK